MRNGAIRISRASNTQARDTYTANARAEARKQAARKRHARTTRHAPTDSHPARYRGGKAGKEDRGRARSETTSNRGTSDHEERHSKPPRPTISKAGRRAERGKTARGPHEGKTDTRPHEIEMDEASRPHR